MASLPTKGTGSVEKPSCPSTRKRFARPQSARTIRTLAVYDISTRSIGCIKEQTWQKITQKLSSSVVARSVCSIAYHLSQNGRARCGVVGKKRLNPRRYLARGWLDRTVAWQAQSHSLDAIQRSTLRTIRSRNWPSHRLASGGQYSFSFVQSALAGDQAYRDYG